METGLNNTTEVDRIIHEPARLRLMMALSGAEAADFNFLLSISSLTKGNLSSHLDRLERAGYIAVAKSFRGKLPHTEYRITAAGRASLAQYWKALDGIRGAGRQ